MAKHKYNADSACRFHPPEVPPCGPFGVQTDLQRHAAGLGLSLIRFTSTHVSN